MKLRVNPLLASVLVLTILYSLNLRILGAPNQPLFQVVWWRPLGNRSTPYLLGICALAAIGAAYVFFSTELGAALRSTGSSASFLTSVGKSVSAYRVFLVALAGGLVSLAGSLLATIYGFADVSLGTGIVVIGIASVIIGESICGRSSLRRQMWAVPIGILLYEIAVSIALSAGISPTDVKLATGLITIALLAFSRNDGEKLLA
jgi:putative ABC transport system permease protein